MALLNVAGVEAMAGLKADARPAIGFRAVFSIDASKATICSSKSSPSSEQQAAGRSAPPENSWLAHMLGRKPRMLVALTLANKMARGIWAMLTKGENYRDPVTAGA
jgi:hypothetical protein